jgi:hypothetical protein
MGGRSPQGMVGHLGRTPGVVTSLSEPLVGRTSGVAATTLGAIGGGRGHP